MESVGIPTMLLFKGGELKATKVGATTKIKYYLLLKKIFNFYLKYFHINKGIQTHKLSFFLSKLFFLMLLQKIFRRFTIIIFFLLF